MVHDTQNLRSTFALSGDIHDEELRSLMQEMFEQTGQDFRSYALSSLRRRVVASLMEEGLTSIQELKTRLGADSAVRQRVLHRMTLPVTTMFRDPKFFRIFRELLIPVLRTYPFVRIWVAGCSTGQEAYSVSIILHEEGLQSRSRVYATDLSPQVIDRAKEGIFPLAVMREYTRNYQEAGGTSVFSEYYTADSELVILRPFLRDNIVFAVHNLVSDGSFNEFNLILCRNVMIYFNRQLQGRVHELFHCSLAMFGYLGLGRSESLRFNAAESHYEVIAATERLYRKIA